MKKKILAIALLVILLFGMTTDAKEENLTCKYYGLITVVVRCDMPTDRVTVMDGNGNLWQFQGVEDWVIGDLACLLMDNNNTELIYDDIIISARYEILPNTENLDSYFKAIHW